MTLYPSRLRRRSQYGHMPSGAYQEAICRPVSRLGSLRSGSGVIASGEMPSQPERLEPAAQPRKRAKRVEILVPAPAQPRSIHRLSKSAEGRWNRMGRSWQNSRAGTVISGFGPLPFVVEILEPVGRTR